jgi:hypothetical protein
MTGGKLMPAATGQTRKAEYGTVIYVRGMDQEQLDAAERHCREYAARFGWHVLESIRDNGTATISGHILAKACRPGVHILLTGAPDMISPDRGTRDDLILAIEGTGCIVHPLTTPCRS